MYWEDMISTTMMDYFHRSNFFINSWLKAELVYYRAKQYNMNNSEIANALKVIADESHDSNLIRQIYDFNSMDENDFNLKYSYGESFTTKFHRIYHPFKKGDMLMIKNNPECLYIVLNEKYNRHLETFYDFEEDGIEVLQLNSNGTFSYVDRAVSPLWFDYQDNFSKIIGERYSDL